MTKKQTLFSLLLIPIIVSSCKKEETNDLDTKAITLHQKNEKLSLNQNRSFASSYGYIFDWDNSISLEDQLNDECGTADIFFSVDAGEEFLILSDQVVLSGGAPARGGIVGGIGGYAGYGPNSSGLLTFEEGANQDIDDFCECVIAHSPVPLVKKGLY